MFDIQHDGANISVYSAFRKTSGEDDEEESRYKLAGGTANVYIDVDDADIGLHKTD